MRFRLDHPSAPGVVADYGYEPILGWWAESSGPGRPRRCYDRLTPGCGYEEAGCAVLEGLVPVMIRLLSDSYTSPSCNCGCYSVA